MRWIAPGLLLLAFSIAPAQGQIKTVPDITDQDCALCHDGSTREIPTVHQNQVSGSVHAGIHCLDCHDDIRQVPHPGQLAPVPCARCHEETARLYTTHGLGKVGTTADIPGCASCHGSHEIKRASDPTSPTHRHSLPTMCARCHRDLNLARDHDITLKQVVEMYETSVHGLAQARGDTLAAVCTDCHGTERSAHRILPRGSSQSSVNHFNIPGTCGHCHGEAESEFWEGIHGKLSQKGDTHAPVCTDCHGEHGILRTDDPRANVSPFRLAEATCSPCHETARINESYEVKTDTEVSFVDSYHGLKSRAGDTTVANCASCHGAHRILPSVDVASSIHPDNLQETCGHCHHGISAAAAQVEIHAPARTSAWVRFVAALYTVLIVVVIGGMLLFVTLDFGRHFKEMLRRPQVRRMDRNAVFQHSLLLVSFTVLVITGFALRYSSFWLFQFLFGWDGGFGVRGTVHRIAAALFLFSTFWHLFYLFTPAGRAFVRAMSPSALDLRQVSQAFGYNLGFRRDPPLFGRFGFVEKAEYWALVWGTAIMAATGFALWYRDLWLRAVSKEFIEVMRTIHLYEAWLATLAILIWHLYSTVWKPGVYPGNPAWLTGRMPAAMYEEEHPAELPAELPGEQSR